MDLTAWQVASLPFWMLAFVFGAKLFYPSKDFRDKIAQHATISLICCGFFAYIAARLWS